ncbi:MAG: Cys-tRNA(Pro) deacylase [Campylobacter sp.]|nr:Cys-tRNA(Pro) deacylase [Campylobacter sp.]
MHKTNAARILDTFNIKYEILEYEFDEEHLDAISASKKSHLNITKVYKTIVCVSENGYLVACLRGDMKLNLKALAKFAGVKRCELLELKNLTKITGYLRGGCSPIGMKKQFDTFIDSKVLENDFIFVSAGVRGKQLKISPKDLVYATNAKVCQIAHQI